jgi:hypothetical protein
MGCPNITLPSLSFKEKGKMRVFNPSTEDVYSVSNRRVFVPVEVLQIATDDTSFNFTSNNSASLDQHGNQVSNRKPYFFKKNSATTNSKYKASTSQSKRAYDEEERKSKVFTADYVFTGSFFNIYRKVMEFNPATIPRWKGAIIGGNWDNPKANVSKAWLDIAVGRLPYELLPEV